MSALLLLLIYYFMRIVYGRNTQIPIIKFIDKKTGISVDVCAKNASALQGHAFIDAQLKKFPALGPMSLVLKFFLYCRELNETYTGE